MVESGGSEPQRYPPSLEVLSLQLSELERRMNIHRQYQDEALEKADHDLQAKLREMNEFRNENRELTATFATVSTLDDRVHMIMTKIQSLDDYIAEGIGKRVTAIEMYRANLDGRFWVWGILITVLTLVLQFWPIIRGK